MQSPPNKSNTHPCPLLGTIQWPNGSQSQIFSAESVHWHSGAFSSSFFSLPDIRINGRPLLGPWCRPLEPPGVQPMCGVMQSMQRNAPDGTPSPEDERSLMCHCHPPLPFKRKREIRPNSIPAVPRFSSGSLSVSGRVWVKPGSMTTVPSTVLVAPAAAGPRGPSPGCASATAPSSQPAHRLRCGVRDI